MKKSTEDYLTGAALALFVIALLISANHIFSEEPANEANSTKWIQDGVLETRAIKLPPEKFQPSRINWDVKQ